MLSPHFLGVKPECIAFELFASFQQHILHSSGHPVGICSLDSSRYISRYVAEHHGNNRASLLVYQYATSQQLTVYEIPPFA